MPSAAGEPSDHSGIEPYIGTGVQVLEFSRGFDGGGSATWPVDQSEGASPSRIFAGHPWNPRIRPRVYRPFEFVIPGTTDAGIARVGTEPNPRTPYIKRGMVNG